MILAVKDLLFKTVLLDVEGRRPVCVTEQPNVNRSKKFKREENSPELPSSLYCEFGDASGSLWTACTCAAAVVEMRRGSRSQVLNWSVLLFSHLFVLVVELVTSFWHVWGTVLGFCTRACITVVMVKAGLSTSPTKPEAVKDEHPCAPQPGPEL